MMLVLSRFASTLCWPSSDGWNIGPGSDKLQRHCCIAPMQFLQAYWAFWLRFDQARRARVCQINEALDIAEGDEQKTTPVGGGGPAGVACSDRQLGGGVLPIPSGRAGRRSAQPRSCPEYKSADWKRVEPMANGTYVSGAWLRRFCFSGAQNLNIRAAAARKAGENIMAYRLQM